MLGKLPMLGRRAVWVVVSQGPTALAVGAGGGCLDFYAPVFHFSSFFLSGRRPDIDSNSVSRAVGPKTTNQMLPL